MQGIYNHLSGNLACEPLRRRRLSFELRSEGGTRFQVSKKIACTQPCFSTLELFVHGTPASGFQNVVSSSLEEAVRR